MVTADKEGFKAVAIPPISSGKHNHPLKCVGLLGGELGRMFGGSPHFLFVFYRSDRRENVRNESRMVSSTYNEHCAVLFIHKCFCFVSKKHLNPAYIIDYYTKNINTYVYI